MDRRSTRCNVLKSLVRAGLGRMSLVCFAIFPVCAMALSPMAFKSEFCVTPMQFKFTAEQRHLLLNANPNSPATWPKDSSIKVDLFIFTLNHSTLTLAQIQASALEQAYGDLIRNSTSNALVIRFRSIAQDISSAHEVKKGFSGCARGDHMVVIKSESP